LQLEAAWYSAVSPLDVWGFNYEAINAPAYKFNTSATFAEP